MAPSIRLDVALHERGGGNKKGTGLRDSVDEKHYMSRPITFQYVPPPLDKVTCSDRSSTGLIETIDLLLGLLSRY